MKYLLTSLIGSHLALAIILVATIMSVESYDPGQEIYSAFYKCIIDPVDLILGGRIEDKVLWLGFLPLVINNYLIKNRIHFTISIFPIAIFFVLNMNKVFRLNVKDNNWWVGTYRSYLDGCFCLLGLGIIYFLLGRAYYKIEKEENVELPEPPPEPKEKK